MCVCFAALMPAICATVSTSPLLFLLERRGQFTSCSTPSGDPRGAGGGCVETIFVEREDAQNNLGGE